MRRVTTILTLVFLLLGSLAVARNVPTLKLRTLEGKRVALTDYLGEGPVLLNFWATWCKPCLAELPKLEAFIAEMEGSGLRLVTVNVDDPKTSKQVAPFVHRHGFEFPVLLDPNQEVLRKLGGRAIPFNVFISAEGQIESAHFGFKPAYLEEWRQLVSAAEEAEETEKETDLE